VIDWEKSNKVLTNKISDMPATDTIHTLASADELDAYVETITTALQDTIQQVVPLCMPFPYKKCWWTKELTKLCHNYRRAEQHEFVTRSSAE
jgi:hypothetical protein